MDSALEALRATVAARRHHLDGATTSTIAGELRVSRFEVARLLDRAVSVTTRQLRAVPDVTAVADGADESTAIRAACRSGLVHRPVTDDRTAEALLVSPTAPS
ncbi:sugar-binding domain-containing protein [Kineococcus sp. NPDC059986]|uniref:sugar-binding domain-containing protein n=1 Tax=Kineococcus sp. NPDC059986 TaxID=3155538 RepID=UPI00344BAE03